MCLETITTTQDPDPTEVRAWKIFSKDREGYLHFPWTLYYSKTKVPTNQWIKAGEKTVYVFPLRGIDTVSYMSGFHAFLDQTAAENFCNAYSDLWLTVREVKIKSIRVKGTQHGLEVVVADEMFVEV